jgi:hypothetical protein
MNQSELLADAARWVVQGAFWSSLAFIGWYTACAPWYRSSVGRAIVAMDTAIALALLPSVLGLLLGRPAVASIAYQWLTVCALGCIPLITCYRMFVVLRIQRRGDRGDR